MDYENKQYRKTIEKCEARLKVMVFFRVFYIFVTLLALAYMAAHGGVQGWLFALLGIVVLFDLLISFGAKQQAEEAVRQQRRNADNERARARMEAEKSLHEIQVNAAQAWADRCQKAHGLVFIRSSYPCKRGEGVLHTENGVCLMETRKVRVSGGNSVDQWTQLDIGTLHVTNQRLVFIGDNGNRSLAIKDIVGTKGFVDGFEVTSCKRSKPMRFTCGNSVLIRSMVNAVQEHPELKLVPEDTLPPVQGEDVHKEMFSEGGNEKRKREGDKRDAVIPNGYLELVSDAAAELGTFVRNLDGEEATSELLGQVDGIDAVESLGVFSTKNAKLGFLVFSDLVKTAKGLGYTLETAEPAELIGLAEGILQVVRSKTDAETLNWADEKACEETKADLVLLERTVGQSVQLSLPDGQFLFPFVFSYSENGQMLGQRYLTLLYRWASVVAKADGVISKAESEWLANIMRGTGMSGVAVPQAGKVKADPVLSKPMRDLEKMVGLESVKAEVSKLANLVRIQQERERQGIKAVSVSYHCVFTGNPGTGKTTVARIVAGIYKDLGVLKKGHLVETDRAGLVAEYVGQTGPKTNKVIDSALDGVLFIDEAYSLVEGGQNDYGKEAVATLLKRMEDDRDRLVVILAGYGENMKRFIESNPGLQSRFNRYIEFPDYEAADLVEIFKRFANTSQYRLGAGAEETLRGVMKAAVVRKDGQFGNGRFARNTFEKAIERQAVRLAGVGDLSKDMLQELLPEDIG